MPHTRPLSHTPTLRWLSAWLLMMAASLLISCGGGGGGGAGEEPLSSAKDVTTFAFTKTANPTLATDVAGVVAGDSILVTLPYGQSRSALAATYTALGVSVSAGGQAQTSGTSVVDFSSPVLYSVTAANGTVKAYTVTVLNAPASAKDISSFTFTSAANPTLPTNIDATVSPDSISAVLPYGTSRAALVASFASTGKTIQVAGKTQVSASTSNNFEVPLTYNVTADDASTKTYTVTVSNALNPAKSITSFAVGSSSASVADNNIALTLPYGTDLSKMVVSFASTGAVVKVGSTLQISGSTANDFSMPVVYTVSAEDGSTQTYTASMTNGLTSETQALRKWLLNNTQHSALGAQWNGGTSSIGWEEQAAISGKMPTVFGIEYYDNGPIEKNLPARETGAKYITEKFSQGGIVTLVDHMPNFVTGGDSWDRKSDALGAIVPGGAAHAEFVAYLDRLAAFLNSLNVKGKPVPVLLRPLHEMNGAWFWWGNAESGARLVQLWRFYHDYLVKKKAVKNVLWVWSPNIDNAASAERYMSYWPGSGYVDVVGLDGYDNSAAPNITNPLFVNSFNAVSSIAKQFGLPVALTEIGAQPGAQEVPDFWDSGVLPALTREFAGASYVLVWNGGYGPKAGTPGADGFRRLAQSGQVLHLGDVRGDQIYGPGFPH